MSKHLKEADWVTKSGLRAVVILTFSKETNTFRHRCGYVAIPPEHPMYGKDVEAVVHGGVSFTDFSSMSGYPDKTLDWWVGFDCAHSGDLETPEYIEAMSKVIGRPWNSFLNNATHKTLEFCIEQCESLAYQIKVMN